MFIASHLKERVIHFLLWKQKAHLITQAEIDLLYLLQHTNSEYLLTQFNIDLFMQLLHSLSTQSHYVLPITPLEQRLVADAVLLNIVEVNNNIINLSYQKQPTIQSIQYFEPLSQQYDTQAPTIISIHLSETILKNGDTAVVTIVFSKPVIHFDNSDVTIENGTLSTLMTNDNITWFGIFTPNTNTQSAHNIISVSNSYTDQAGNIGSSATSANYTIDTQAPIVNSIIMSNPHLKIGESSTLTITFSEAVIHFDNTDVTVENGTLSTLTTVDNITWTAIFTSYLNIENNNNFITVSPTYTNLSDHVGFGATSSAYTIDTKAPIIHSITMSNTALKIGETSLVTIIFSEPVIHFDNTDVTVHNGTLSHLTTNNNGITWIGTFTPFINIESANNVIFIANTYTDILGNIGSSSTSANYTIDTTSPILNSIIVSNMNLILGDTTTVTITFSEAITGFDNSSVIVENGTLSTLTTNDHGITWSATFTPTPGIESTNNIITVTANYTDLAGNIGSSSTSANYTIDTKPPTISAITMSDTALKIGDTSTLTITFSEAVTGFDNTDVTVQNGSLGTLVTSNGGITWTATFTPTANTQSATNVITVANTYTDLAGNPGSSGTSANYAIDTKAPTISSITMNDTSLTIGETATLTITFSEAVTGFDNTDVTVQNGSLGTLVTSNGGITWTATFTPTANIQSATNTISVANTYTDLAGNAGSSGTSANYAIDTKAPTISSITMSDTSLTIGETSTLTITFSEAVTGFDNTDVTVQNGSLGTLVTSNGGITWTATFTPTTNTQSATNVITVANTYTDLAGNAGSSGTSANYVVDTKAPTISSITMSDTSLTIGETATLTITFSEAVTGFDNTDVTVQNGSLGSLVTSNGGITWTAIFTPTTNTQSATNVITVANTYTDLAGNAGSSGTSANYAIDTKAPTISSITMSDTSLTIGETSTLTITFSEAVTGFDNTDVTVQNGSLGTLVTNDGGITWSATFTPSTNIQSATNTISVANTYTDLAGNAGSSGTSANYSIDTKAPTVSSITMSDTALKIGDTSILTIIFSEAVTGFDNSDVTVQNGSLGTLVTSNGGITWTATFTPTANTESATNIITVANTYTNLAGNAGSSGTSANYSIDTKAPIVSSIIMSDTNLIMGDTSMLTITFSEAVTNFDNTDVTVQNGSLGPLITNDSGITWKEVFTPTANIESAINVISVASTYTDLAGNVGSGRTSSNYVIDTKPPTISSITMSDTALQIGDTSTLTITFSEAVTGFNNSDVTVQNGSLSTLTTSNGGITWTGTFTPSTNIQSATNVINVANTYTDLAGNAGTSGSSANYSIDTKAPTISSITMSDTALSIGETATLTITFSEAVTGFNNSDVTVQNGSLSTLTTSNGGITWTGTFTPNTNTESATNIISVANTYTDLAGNGGSSGTSANYTIDTLAPSISITNNETPNSILIIGNILYTFTFNEPVTGFTTSDIAITAGTKGAFTAVSSSVYTLVVTPLLPTVGLVTITIAAGAAQDLAGNNSVAKNYTDNSIGQTSIFNALELVEGPQDHSLSSFSHINNLLDLKYNDLVL